MGYPTKSNELRIPELDDTGNLNFCTSDISPTRIGK